MCAYSRRKCFSNKAISKWPLTSLSRSDSDLWKSCMAAAIVGDPEPACAHRHTHSFMHTYTGTQANTNKNRETTKKIRFEFLFPCTRHKIHTRAQAGRSHMIEYTQISLVQWLTPMFPLLVRVQQERDSRRKAKKEENPPTSSDYSNTDDSNSNDWGIQPWHTGRVGGRNVWQRLRDDDCVWEREGSGMRRVRKKRGERVMKEEERMRETAVLVHDEHCRLSIAARL